jgi:hypothetical protein
MPDDTPTFDAPASGQPDKVTIVAGDHVRITVQTMQAIVGAVRANEDHVTVRECSRANSGEVLLVLARDPL